MNIREGLTFNDVLLVPKHSAVQSRSTISIATDLGKGVQLGIPIISANMKSVTEAEMCKVMARRGGLALIHRFMTPEAQCEMFKPFKDHWRNVGCSVGVKEEDYARADVLVQSGCKIICVDVAHGDHELCMNMCVYISEKYPDVLLIAGNVATGEAALRLWKAGADAIKVGVGPGSLCTTRIETGNGVPQLTALWDVHEARKRSDADFAIIADGGIRNAGCIVKALCFAEAVMLGSLLAGTDETPGQVITIGDKQYKQYAGSSTHRASHVEGVSAIVPLKGPVDDILRMLVEGVKSGCSYQGARSLRDLQTDPEFVRLSHSGLSESKPHLIER